jgi:hypothetical protein
VSPNPDDVQEYFESLPEVQALGAASIVVDVSEELIVHFEGELTADKIKKLSSAFRKTAERFGLKQ